MLKTIREKARQSMSLHSSPNLKSTPPIIKFRKPTKPHPFEKEPAKTVAQWVIPKRTAPKGPEKLEPSLQIKKLHLMISQPKIPMLLLTTMKAKKTDGMVLRQRCTKRSFKNTKFIKKSERKTSWTKVKKTSIRNSGKSKILLKWPICQQNMRKIKNSKG